MTKKGKYSEKEFSKVKKLLSLNLSQREVSEITGWGKSVVNDTNRFKDFNEYREYIIDKAAKEKKNKLKKANPQESHNTLEHSTNWGNSNEYKVAIALESIAESLEKLSNYLENQTPLNKEAKESWLFGRR